MKYVYSSNPLIGEPKRPKSSYLVPVLLFVGTVGFGLCSERSGCGSGCTRAAQAKTRVGEMGPILEGNNNLQTIEFGMKMIARARENGIALNEAEIAEYLLGAIGTLKDIRKGSGGKQKAKCKELIRKARILGGEALKSLIEERKNNWKPCGKFGRRVLAASLPKGKNARLPRDALRA